jgi:hypothetical protein
MPRVKQNLPVSVVKLHLDADENPASRRPLILPKRLSVILCLERFVHSSLVTSARGGIQVSMDPRYLAVVPSVMVLVAICAGFVIRSFMRGRVLPNCWRCGAPKVRPSHSAGFLDVAASLILLRPFRCKGCRVRFYSPRFLGDRFTKKRARPLPEPAPARSTARNLQTQNPV